MRQDGEQKQHPESQQAGEQERCRGMRKGSGREPGRTGKKEEAQQRACPAVFFPGTKREEKGGGSAKGTE